MKSYLWALLTVLIATHTFATEKSISAVKTFDGSVARCQEGADVGNIAHRLTIKSVTRSKVMTQMKVEVSFLQCERIGKKFALVSRHPAVIENHGMTFSNLELVLADHRFQILTTRSLQLNQANQTIQLEFPTDIESEVNEIFVRGLLNDQQGTALSSFGSFRLHFN